MRLKILYLITGLMIITASCGPQETPQTVEPTETTETPSETAEGAVPESRTLTVMTHDSFAASKSVINTFQSEHNVEVRFLEAGDTGTSLNKAILSKDNPLADVFYGVDNTFLSRALEEGIFESYNSSLMEDIPDRFELDTEHRALPVDFGDVCLNYEKAYFEENNLEPPLNLEDLLDPQYKSLLVVENPATSSPGLAFLFATIGYFGEEGYLDYWNGLVENDVKVVNDWETAYRAEFSQAGGSRPIVVSYASSPPFELLYAEQQLDEPPTVAVTSDGSCFRQIEFVGILKGTQNRELAEKWVDFMLSPTFQEDIPLNMFVFPVNTNAELDEAFINFLSIPDQTASVSPADIAANREKWINVWTEAVLR